MARKTTGTTKRTARVPSRSKAKTAEATATEAPESPETEAPEASATPKQQATVLPSPDSPQVIAKRDLIERVVESSGIKKKDAKPVVEAMLRELGEALSRGDTLNLQPLGKGIVKNRKALANADVIELRLRRSKQAMADAAEDAAGEADEKSDTPAPSTGTDPLAEAAE